MKKLGNILLGVWLVLTGLISLTDFNFKGSSAILAVTAVIAGALLLIGDRGEKFAAHMADYVLGIWLILVGLVPLINIRFQGMHGVLAVIALMSGVLIVIRR